MGWAGWIGASLLAVAAIWMAAVDAEPPLLGALAWTGYVLAVDSSALACRGSSLLRTDPAAFAWLAVLSVFLWLPFEWYNLRLAAWNRTGLPAGVAGHCLLGWSFACVWPALFATADLVSAGCSRPPSRKPSGVLPPLIGRTAMLAGVAALGVPLVVPRLDFGEHLMPLVPVGFFLLLDPWNARRGWPSLLFGGRAAQPPRVIGSLVLGAVLCGMVADGLNGLAVARWNILASLEGSPRLVEMPLEAYAALPALGAAAHAMHAWAVGMLGLPSGRALARAAVDGR